MMRGVTKEGAQGGLRSEFVGSCGRNIGVATTPKDTELNIGGRVPVEHHVVGGKVECLGRKNVKKKGGGRNSLNPIGWWNTSLK